MRLLRVSQSSICPQSTTPQSSRMPAQLAGPKQARVDLQRSLQENRPVARILASESIPSPEYCEKRPNDQVLRNRDHHDRYPILRVRVLRCRLKQNGHRSNNSYFKHNEEDSSAKVFGSRCRHGKYQDWSDNNQYRQNNTDYVE
jgi:hypothetical protein